MRFMSNNNQRVKIRRENVGTKIDQTSISSPYVLHVANGQLHAQNIVYVGADRSRFLW